MRRPASRAFCGCSPHVLISGPGDPGGSAALPLAEVEGEKYFHGQGVPAGDPVDEILAVIWPISSMGTWMVVSMGDKYWAVSMSSMLITEMSLGDAQGSCPGCAHGADGRHVVAAEKCGEKGLLLQKLQGAF